MDSGKERTMRHSIMDGALWAVMRYCADIFVTPFAIAIGAPVLVISAANAFPSLLDGIGQKAGSYVTALGMNRKKVFVYTVLLQAFSWLGLVMSALSFLYGMDPTVSQSLLVLSSCMIYVFGGIPNPAWFSLMGDVVPARIRAVWFGERSKIMYAAGLLALLVSGWFLGQAAVAVAGFAILFFIAFVSRALGAYYASLHTDPGTTSKKSAEPDAGFAKYTYMQMFMMFATLFGSPFIAVYLISQRGFSYQDYSIMVAFNLVAYVLTMPGWGRLIARYSSKTVLVAAAALNGLFMLLLPSVHTLPEAVAVMFVSGCMWSGIMSGNSNYVYESVPPHARMRAIGDASLMGGIGSFLGALSGGFALHSLGENSVASFYAVFYLSMLLRFASSAAYHFFAEERKPFGEKTTPLSMMVNIVAVYPASAIAQGIGGISFPVRVNALRRLKYLPGTKIPISWKGRNKA
jgi:MFS family permease